MGSPLTINVTRRGGVTIPQELREKYDLKQGDVLSLIDLDGAFVVKPGRLETDHLADRIRERLQDNDESLKSVMKSLRDRRERAGD